VPNWWDGDGREAFWVEITDRDVIGENLWAPQVNENGRPYWSYEMVTWVQEGDTVLHFRTPEAAFTGWSRAVGPAFDTEIEWGAHGYASGRGPVTPYHRAAWQLPLDGPYPIDPPVTMAQLQRHERRIASVYAQLEAERGRPLYFPFQLSARRPMRAFQGYMTKMPRALMEALPELQPVLAEADRTRPTARRPAPATPRRELGADYRRADEEPETAAPDPNAVDPNLVDRALAAHARTQNALADWLAARGLVPRSPAPGEPSFDLAWEAGGTVNVAEIKSMANTNEEKQLRLGLGQLLRYGQQLGASGKPVRMWLVAERRPSDKSWVDLTKSVGVELCWPPAFSEHPT
jgi:hypothetical protein